MIFKETLKTFFTLLIQSKNLRKRSKKINNLEKFIEPLIQNKNLQSTSLDLGSGTYPRNLFNCKKVYGIDIRKDTKRNVKAADLVVDPIPFQDNFFDFCTAFDFIEHIPRYIRIKDKQRYPFIELMNEIYRVLKTGGIFLHNTPAYPSKQSFQDPTHLNIITEDTFSHYFCINNKEKIIFPIRKKEIVASIYGFKGKFEILDQGWMYGGVNLVSILKKI